MMMPSYVERVIDVKEAFLKGKFTSQVDTHFVGLIKRHNAKSEANSLFNALSYLGLNR
jgi:hypothetical protein